MSNASNTVWLVDNYDVAVADVNLYTAFVSLGASILQLLVLAYVENVFDQNHTVTRKQVNSVVNNTLVVMIFTNPINTVTYYYSTITEGPASAANMIISNASNVLFYAAYFQYSWTRGRNVIDNVLPGVIPFIPYYFIVFILLELATNTLYTILCLIPATDPAYDTLNTWTNNTYTAATILLFPFDAGVMAAYIRYMWHVRGDFADADVGALRVISRFGIASLGVFFLGLFGEMISSYVAWDYSDPGDCSASLIVMVLNWNVDTLYLFLQVWMKVQLGREREAEGERRRNLVDRARRMTGSVSREVAALMPGPSSVRRSRASSPATT
ncbi:hypothetical protein BC830DRAFT_16748 [Chytriomyces sp. MP71]|nr:hypothetical protein BC830DRAFT_16748 [Chytriomyces sp. MP71]